MNSWNI